MFYAARETISPAWNVINEPNWFLGWMCRGTVPHAAVGVLADGGSDPPGTEKYEECQQQQKDSSVCSSRSLRPVGVTVWNFVEKLHGNCWKEKSLMVQILSLL